MTKKSIRAGKALSSPSREAMDRTDDRALEDAVAMLESGVFGLTACGSHMTDDGHDIAPYVRTVELALLKLRRHVVPYEGVRP